MLEGASNLSFPIAEVVSWLLYIAIGLLLIALVVGAIYGFRLRKKKQSTSNPSTSQLSNEQLLEEMEEAARRGEYSLAIEKCFQYLLKEFSEKTELFFAAARTNGEYRLDVQQKFPAGAKIFHDLSLYFDEVWYGEKKVGLIEYQQYRQDVFRFLGEVELVEKK